MSLSFRMRYEEESHNLEIYDEISHYVRNDIQRKKV